MRIAYLGDIVGGLGVRTACAGVRLLREAHAVDYAIANAENAANGSGLTPELARKLIDAGFDALTLGDHAFRKQQIRAMLEDESAPLLRPHNLPETAWGRGVCTVERVGRPPLHLVIVVGRLFMTTLQGSDPYAAADAAVADIKRRHPGRPAIIVEIHAEATSEKVAMGWHLNDRVSAVLGSHTHVPAADTRLLPSPTRDDSLPGSGSLLPGGTAYQTDLGMTGPQDGVLGRRADRVLRYMTRGIPAAFDVAEGNPAMQGVLIDIDDDTGRATRIQRVQDLVDSTPTSGG